VNHLSVDCSYVNNPARVAGMEAVSRLHLTPEGLALGALLRSHRVLLDEVEKQLRDKVGLSFPLYEALATLATAPEQRLRMVDITRRMCVSKGNVTQLIDKLERQDLVTREPSPTDRRLVYALLTKRGRKAAEQGTEIFNHAAQERFARFVTKDEIENVAAGLTKVIAALEPDSIVSATSAERVIAKQRGGEHG
jgi:DNA-binding MarR family transcriptional regulator